MPEINYQAIQDQLAGFILREGERTKNHFPNLLACAIRTKAWKQFTKLDGTKFKDMVEWLHYQFPSGCHMGGTQFALTYEDAIQLCQDRDDVLKVLLKHKPKKKPLNGKEPTEKPTNNGTAGRFDNIKKYKSGTSAAYLLGRLERDHPVVYQRHLRREKGYETVHKAAIKAGIVPARNVVAQLKSAWRKASAEDQAEFRRWLRTKEAKASDGRLSDAPCKECGKKLPEVRYAHRIYCSRKCYRSAGRRRSEAENEV